MGKACHRPPAPSVISTPLINAKRIPAGRQEENPAGLAMRGQDGAASGFLHHPPN